MQPLKQFVELLRQYMAEYKTNRSTLYRYIVGAFSDLVVYGTDWANTGDWSDVQIALAEQLKKGLQMARGVGLNMPMGATPPAFVRFYILLKAMSAEERIALTERILQMEEEGLFEWHESWRVHTATFHFSNALDEERMWLNP